MGKRLNGVSFIEICDDLEKKYKQGENEVAYIRKYIVSNKLNENYDCLLKIKAEAEDCETNSFFSLLVCVISMFFAGISFMFQVFSKMPDTLNNIIAVIFLVIAIISLMHISIKYFGCKNTSVAKWRKYVLIIVNEFIRELQEKQSEMQKINKHNTMQGNKMRKNKNTSHRK